MRVKIEKEVITYDLYSCVCVAACVCYLNLAWKLWKQFNVAEKDVTSVDEITENESSYRPEQKEYLKKNKGKVAI